MNSSNQRNRFFSKSRISMKDKESTSVVADLKFTTVDSVKISASQMKSHQLKRFSYSPVFRPPEKQISYTGDSIQVDSDMLKFNKFDVESMIDEKQEETLQLSTSGLKKPC